MPNDLRFSDHAHGLQSSIRGLHGTPTTPLPFLDGVVVRSFVLERPAGNIIVYNSPGIDEASEEIADLGLPRRLVINHHHEAMYGTPALDVPIWIHEKDRARTDMPIAGTFTDRETIDDDLEIIPTPGHTPGTTMVLWSNGEHRFLFPGDSLWVQGGEWKAVLLKESNRADYLESLALLKTIAFDYLVPWGIEAGAPYGYATSRNEATEKLERIMHRLRSGENA